MNCCISKFSKNVQFLHLPSIAGFGVWFFPLNGTCLLKLETNSSGEIHGKHLDSLTTRA